MKKPHEEGIASHSAPSFAPSTARCQVKRKQGHGWASIELRKIAIGMPTLSSKRKATRSGAIARVSDRSRVVVDPRHVQKLYAREPGDLGGACSDPTAGRRGKANSRTPRAHVFEESDGGIGPMNHSNKDGKPSAESEEGRPLVKENTHQSSTDSTQSEARVSQGLERVRKVARERKGTKFTALLHHLTVGLLRESFFVSTPN